MNAWICRTSALSCSTKSTIASLAMSGSTALSADWIRMANSRLPLDLAPRQVQTPHNGGIALISIVRWRTSSSRERFPAPRYQSVHFV